MSNKRQRRSNPLLSKQERLNLERFLNMALKQVVLEIYFFCIFVIVEVQGIYETNVSICLLWASVRDRLKISLLILSQLTNLHPPKIIIKLLVFDDFRGSTS